MRKRVSRFLSFFSLGAMHLPLIQMPQNAAAQAGPDLAPQPTEYHSIAAYPWHLYIVEYPAASSDTARDTALDPQMLH